MLNKWVLGGGMPKEALGTSSGKFNKLGHPGFPIEPKYQILPLLPLPFLVFGASGPGLLFYTHLARNSTAYNFRSQERKLL